MQDRPIITWENSALGPFEWIRHNWGYFPENEVWCGTTITTAFADYTFVPDNDRRTVGDIDVVFRPVPVRWDPPPNDQPPEPPTAEAQEVMVRTLASLEAFQKVIASRLWDALIGRARHGMWWDDGLASLNTNLGIEMTDAAELPPFMKLRRIVVSEQLVDDKPELLSKLVFAARFEPEHGVAVWTDGSEILGFRYDEQRGYALKRS